MSRANDPKPHSITGGYPAGLPVSQNTIGTGDFEVERPVAAGVLAGNVHRRDRCFRAADRRVQSRIQAVTDWPGFPCSFPNRLKALVWRYQSYIRFFPTSASRIIAKTLDASSG